MSQSRAITTEFDTQEMTVEVNYAARFKSYLARKVKIKDYRKLCC